VSNSSLAAHEATMGDTLYFHPPTRSNPHQDELIFKGKNRFDMHFIKGGKLSDVQAALDQARKAHPEDVIVAHLKGVFIADGAGPSGLSLPDFTCVILDGEIQSNNEQLREVILLGGNGCASFSGGVIDCNGKGLDGKRSGYAINVPGDNLALVDAVTLRNSFKESIMTQHHTRLDRSLVIRDCTIENSGRRGIWGHVSQNVVIVNCDVRDSESDGIDIDAHCMHAKVLGNRCSGNQRHGVFVEEAVKGALVFGNHLHDNYRGIHVWNEEVIGNTGPNLFACNLLEKNERGFSVGGRADDRTAHTNFFFNNISRLNEQGLAVIKHADENYFCENWLYDNDEDFLDWTGKAGSVWWLGRSDKERK
ncbi:MAG: right-handed parallel beta-helix repeat-containing protein, partial [Planctomycetota bacterium]